MDRRTGGLSRRSIIFGSAAGAAALVLVPALASADAAGVAAMVKKVVGDKEPKEGKIKLELPSIAENGLVVPLVFSVDSPMTEKDYVKSVHFYAEGNPLPEIASFHFTPMSPKAAGQIRVRLAKTQNVVAIATMSNGDVYKASQEVKVTIGGCGG
jgi:sulfur-oxidizing protein SoxY